MQFNSYEFILAFIPILLLVYYGLIVSQKQKYLNAILLLASVIFYAYSDLAALAILFALVLINYGIYRAILFHGEKGKKRVFLIVGLIGNLAVLIYFKYTNFFIDSLNLVFNQSFQILDIIQPLGISFIVFQQIAFLVDSYRGEIDSCTFTEYLLFITWFPHVSSGPILLHGDLLPDLKNKKRIDWDRISTGIYIFVMGLGKKVLIADLLAQPVNWAYSNIGELNTTGALFISIVYSLQIYFDFSGYSDMAIGISRILGLDLPINFNSPYKAVTILDFWDRWHMTLTRFFTRYLYIPLGGSRKGRLRIYTNTLIVFLLSGIWHGASYTFILWGLLHGLFMIITKQFKSGFNRIPAFVNRCITLLFVNFTWMLFRAGSFSSFKGMAEAILRLEWGALNTNITDFFKPLSLSGLGYFGIPGWLWAVGTVIVLGVLVFGTENVVKKAEKLTFSAGSSVAVCLVAILCLLSFSGVSSFIYAMF